MAGFGRAWARGLVVTRHTPAKVSSLLGCVQHLLSHYRSSTPVSFYRQPYSFGNPTPSRHTVRKLLKPESMFEPVTQCCHRGGSRQAQQQNRLLGRMLRNLPASESSGVGETDNPKTIYPHRPGSQAKRIGEAWSLLFCGLQDSMSSDFGSWGRHPLYLNSNSRELCRPLGHIKEPF